MLLNCKVGISLFLVIYLDLIVILLNFVSKLDLEQLLLLSWLCHHIFFRGKWNSLQLAFFYLHKPQSNHNTHLFSSHPWVSLSAPWYWLWVKRQGMFLAPAKFDTHDHTLPWKQWEVLALKQTMIPEVDLADPIPAELHETKIANLPLSLCFIHIIMRNCIFTWRRRL